MTQTVRMALGGALMLAAFVGPWGAAGAVTSKECSVKYQAAKKAGTLDGANYKSFRAQYCASGAAASAGTTPTTNASTTPPASPNAVVSKPSAPVAASGPATFPSAIDSKYSKETPGKARLHTCLDQYKANKAAGGNGGLRWVQKGGGYYSECSKKLKG